MTRLTSAYLWYSGHLLTPHNRTGSTRRTKAVVSAVLCSKTTLKIYNWRQKNASSSFDFLGNSKRSQDSFLASKRAGLNPQSITNLLRTHASGLIFTFTSGVQHFYHQKLTTPLWLRKGFSWIKSQRSWVGVRSKPVARVGNNSPLHPRWQWGRYWCVDDLF